MNACRPGHPAHGVYHGRLSRLNTPAPLCPTSALAVLLMDAPGPLILSGLQFPPATQTDRLPPPNQAVSGGCGSELTPQGEAGSAIQKQDRCAPESPGTWTR